MSEPGRKTGGEVLEVTRKRTRTPKMYKVVLHNDDFTTMEFVQEVLEAIFQKGPAEAHRVVMLVHTTGYGVCGAYTYEVAETKVGRVHEAAREAGFPLRASMEQE